MSGISDLESGPHGREGHTGYVNSAAVSPDGKHVVTASSDKTARVWHLANGTCLHMLKGHTKQVRSAAVSPDGELVVTASDDFTARVWRLSGGTCLHMLKGHTDCVFSAMVSADGVERHDGARVEPGQRVVPSHSQWAYR